MVLAEQQRVQFLRKRADVLDIRTHYRSMLYDAITQRFDVIESYELRKTEEELLERKAEELGELKGIDANMFALLLAQVAMTMLFVVFTDYENNTEAQQHRGEGGAVTHYMRAFLHMGLFVFVGFGFLLPSERKQAYAGVGTTMLVGAAALQWAQLCNGLFHFAANDDVMVADKVIVDFPALINALYAVAAVLVSGGALFGMLGPFELVLMACLEVAVYALNFYIGYHSLHAVDYGAGLYVHLFGAAFGMAASEFVRPRVDEAKKETHQQVYRDSTTSTYRSEVLPMLGTVLLFVLFPSFNAALAPAGTQHRVINTVLALAASAVTWATVGRMLNEDNQFSMAWMRTATLAGGVAVTGLVGITAHPAVAMAVGVVASLMSQALLLFMSPMLAHFNVHDIGEVFSRHFVPARVGWVASEDVACERHCALRRRAGAGAGAAGAANA